MTIRLYPPIWFLTGLVLQLVLVRQVPSPVSVLMAFRGLGPVVIGMGIVLFLAAAWAFRRQKTTILPFEDSTERLIDSGVFRISRNPIYLAEAIILTGAAVSAGHIWPWSVIPLFVWGIAKSVISWEETTLLQRFGEAYAAYCQRTRRWF